MSGKVQLHKTKRVGIILAFILFIAMESRSQVCMYLAYDGFQYDNNLPLHGQSGSTGWESPWEVQSGNITIPGYQTLIPSLSYQALQTSGIRGSGGMAYLTAGRKLQAGNPGPFANYVATGQTGIGTHRGDTLWYSVLLSKTQSNDQSVFSILHDGNIPWYHQFNGSLRVGVGYFGDESNVNNQKRWTLLVGTTFYPTEAIASGPSFFVLRLIFGENSTTIDLFLNPDVIGNQGPPQSATLSVQTTALFNFISNAIYLGNDPGNGQIDEIRFAESWRCATPDSTVEVNMPPVASFEMTPGQGTAPLMVQFNSDSSYDPENSALTYQWNFGDGSAPSNEANPIHLYDVTGEIPVSLTVTDPEGLSHTLYKTLMLLNVNGSYGCLSSVTCLNMPACGQTDGRIRVNAGNDLFQMKDSLNNLLNPVNNNEFHNLAPGKYQLFVSGNGTACRDTFQLYLQTDSTTCQNWVPDSCGMEIGTNMSSFADWSFERPMKNLFKHIRSDILTYNDASGCWDCGVAGELALDPNGYPMYLPQNTSIGATLVRYVISTNGGNLRKDSSYILLYDGTGTININGMLSILSDIPGRILFKPLDQGNFYINITSSLQGNHVRNIRIVRPQHEADNLDTDPFYEGFLSKIAPFSTLRFMDWGRTNNSPLTSWEERATKEYFSYATDAGVPYEIMVQLANFTGKDPWICVPHMADSAFNAQMAIYFRDHLDPQRKIWLEYSNEVWNWIFAQAHYNNNNRPLNLNYGRAMAEKAGKVFSIWHEVFTGQECRVKRVLGMQAGNNGLNEQILSQLKQDAWDYGSPTHYFGLTHGPGGDPVLDSASTVENVMQNAMNTWSASAPLVKRDYDNVKVFGKEVVTYEGGQHFVGNVFGIPYDYQQAMWDAQYSEEMYDMYREIHQTIRKWSCRLAVNFSLASPQESVYGSWGVLSDIDMEPPYQGTAPKYQALLDELPPSGSRDQFRWTGNRSSLWSDGCNWNQGVLPGSASSVYIPGIAAHQPIVNVNTEVKALQVAFNAILTILEGFVLTVGD